MKRFVTQLLILFSISCSKNDLSSCGPNSAEFSIDDKAFCTQIHECGSSSWKKSSQCGNDGKSNKLLIWVHFEDMLFSGLGFPRFTSFRLEVKNFEGIGTYELYFSNISGDGSHLLNSNYDNIIENGVLEVTELSKRHLSGKVILNLNHEGVKKEALVRLYKIKLDQ